MATKTAVATTSSTERGVPGVGGVVPGVGVLWVVGVLELSAEGRTGGSAIGFDSPTECMAAR
ncbi:hypothetical protein GCM10009738_01320 [Kitasatospora viridis]